MASHVPRGGPTGKRRHRAQVYTLIPPRPYRIQPMARGGASANRMRMAAKETATTPAGSARKTGEEPSRVNNGALL